MSKVLGYRYSVEWSNPYKPPLDGQPLVKAEMFETANQRDERMARGEKTIPEKIRAMHQPGDGYCVCFQAICEPVREMSQEKLAVIRKKRLVRRMEKKYPLFAQEMIDQEISRNPDYYAGITRDDLREGRESAERLHKELIERFETATSVFSGEEK